MALNSEQTGWNFLGLSWEGTRLLKIVWETRAYYLVHIDQSSLTLDIAFNIASLSVAIYVSVQQLNYEIYLLFKYSIPVWGPVWGYDELPRKAAAG